MARGRQSWGGCGGLCTISVSCTRPCIVLLKRAPGAGCRSIGRNSPEHTLDLRDLVLELGAKPGVVRVASRALQRESVEEGLGVVARDVLVLLELWGPVMMVVPVAVALTFSVLEPVPEHVLLVES